MRTGLLKTLSLGLQKACTETARTDQKPTANHAPATKRGNENE